MSEREYVTCEECKQTRINCHELCQVIRDSREERIITLERRVAAMECKIEQKFGKLNAMGWATLGGLSVNLLILLVSHFLNHAPVK